MQLGLEQKQEQKLVRLLKREIKPSLSAGADYKGDPWVVLTRRDINGEKSITAHVAGLVIDVTGPKASYELGEQFSKASVESLSEWLAWRACQQALRDHNLLDAQDRHLPGLQISGSTKGHNPPQFTISDLYHPLNKKKINYIKADFHDGRELLIKGTARIFGDLGHAELYKKFQAAASPDISHDDLELAWDMNDPDENPEELKKKLSPNARPWEYLKELVAGETKRHVVITEANVQPKAIQESHDSQIANGTNLPQMQI